MLLSQAALYCHGTWLPVKNARDTHGLACQNLTHVSLLLPLNFLKGSMLGRRILYMSLGRALPYPFSSYSSYLTLFFLSYSFISLYSYLISFLFFYSYYISFLHFSRIFIFNYSEIIDHSNEDIIQSILILHSILILLTS